MRILVVDDEVQIAHMLQEALSLEGYAVDIAYNGEEGESLAESVPYDLIILDILLPVKNGFDVCRSLRSKKVETPVLLLTGRMKTDADQVKGLDCGADDYLLKPIHLSVLNARVRALLRRKAGISSPIIKVGNLTMDTITKRVNLGQNEITLTSKEYAILSFFIQHPGIVITRSQLEDHIWNGELDNISNMVDAHIKNLRKKLRTENYIETVRGSGYRLNSK